MVQTGSNEHPVRTTETGPVRSRSLVVSTLVIHTMATSGLHQFAPLKAAF